MQEMTEVGKAIYQRWKDLLQEKEIRFREDETREVIHFEARGIEGLNHEVCFYVNPDNTINVVNLIPSLVPPDKLLEAAAAVCVANLRIRVGLFTLDLSDGQIVFHIKYRVFTEAAITKELLEFFLDAALVISERYNDRFFMLNQGVLSLEEFIAKEEE